MQEIKIPRNKFIMPIGLISGIAAIVIAWVLFGAADGPRITSATGVRAIAIFVGMAGILVFVVIIRELLNPNFLVINQNGIDSKRSFGFVPWEQVISVKSYEQVEGGGNYGANVKGLLIEVKDPYKFLVRLGRMKKFAAARSYRLRGSPVFINSADWGWSQDKIAEKLHSYFEEFGDNSASGNAS